MALDTILENERDPAWWEGRAKVRDEVEADARQKGLVDIANEHARVAAKYRAKAKELRPRPIAPHPGKGA